MGSYAAQYGGFAITAAISPSVTVGVALCDGNEVTQASWDGGQSFPDSDHYLRRLCEIMGTTSRIRVSSTSSIPAGSGLGSSSAFLVALVASVYTAFGRRWTIEDIARQASALELELRGVGRQDVLAAAYGGVNEMEFHKSGRVTMRSVELSASFQTALEGTAMLWWTGRTRRSSDILELQRQKLVRGDEQEIQRLDRLKATALRIQQQLYAEDLEAIGRSMHEHWQIKRKGAAMTSRRIDEAYNSALRFGAWGGKLVGAGGGGHLLLLAPVDRSATISRCLSDAGFSKVPFALDRFGVRPSAGDR